MTLRHDPPGAADSGRDGRFDPRPTEAFTMAAAAEAGAGGVREDLVRQIVELMQDAHTEAELLTAHECIRGLTAAQE